jgi:hypothetical protein
MLLNIYEDVTPNLFGINIKLTKVQRYKDDEVIRFGY